MRIGAWLADGPAAGSNLSEAAEAAGVFGILQESPAAIARAAEVAARTTDPRVIVRVLLGSEHPVTLAEEVAVLDHLSAGRVVCVVDTGSLTASEAAEDLLVLRASWSARMFRHEGSRWQVPGGVMGDDLPRRISVTPKPAQLDIPVWLDGAAAGEMSGATGLPVLARELAQVDGRVQVQPGVVVLTGDVEVDRSLVVAWSDAGATHLLVRPPAGAPPDFFRAVVARYLQPEVAMPGFPRVMADSALPLTWTAP